MLNWSGDPHNDLFLGFADVEGGHWLDWNLRYHLLTLLLLCRSWGGRLLGTIRNYCLQVVLRYCAFFWDVYLVNKPGSLDLDHSYFVLALVFFGFVEIFFNMWLNGHFIPEQSFCIIRELVEPVAEWSRWRRADSPSLLLSLLAHQGFLGIGNIRNRVHDIVLWRILSAYPLKHWRRLRPVSWLYFFLLLISILFTSVPCIHGLDIGSILELNIRDMSLKFEVDVGSLDRAFFFRLVNIVSHHLLDLLQLHTLVLFIKFSSLHAPDVFQLLLYLFQQNSVITLQAFVHLEVLVLDLRLVDAVHAIRVSGHYPILVEGYHFIASSIAQLGMDWISGLVAPEVIILFIAISWIAFPILLCCLSRVHWVHLLASLLEVGLWITLRDADVGVNVPLKLLRIFSLVCESWAGVVEVAQLRVDWLAYFVLPNLHIWEWLYLLLLLWLLLVRIALATSLPVHPALLHLLIMFLCVEPIKFVLLLTLKLVINTEYVYWVFLSIVVTMNNCLRMDELAVVLIRRISIHPGRLRRILEFVNLLLLKAR